MAYQPIASLFDLKGRGALVTGGAMGIGEAIALRLGEAGARVMIADIDEERAVQVARHIEAGGGRAQAIRADVSAVADAHRMAQATVEAFGSLDILVNNATTYSPSPALQISEEMWDKVLDTDLKGMFFCAQGAAREMVKAKQGGRIINITSIGAYHPPRNLAHYSSSKGAVVMLTKTLALELAPHRILVNAVAPASVWTPGIEQMAMSSASPGTTVEQVRKRFGERIPIGRAGEPDDIARVVLFLASPAADYLTGSVIVADGGLLLT
ncbi:MAG: SDR family oxidoreductase [Chloroflexi bacterium]|nr:SDR family oxidoreductase [Chloroflexota bacterium]